jgi:hypothetical protein
MGCHHLGVQEDIALITEIETDVAGLSVHAAVASTFDELGRCFVQLFYVFRYSIIKEVFRIRVSEFGGFEWNRW